MLMDQEPMKNAEKGIRVAALRISGFHVEEEKPKQDTSEMDAWAKEVMRETEQRAKAKKQEHNPPKVKPKVITYPKVNIVTVSPRDPQIPNPFGHLYSHQKVDAQTRNPEILPSPPGHLRPRQRPNRHGQKVPRRTPGSGPVPRPGRHPRTRRGATRV